MDDIFAVQDDIARTVVEKLKVKLLGTADAPLVRKPTDNLEPYNLVLQGRYYSVRVTGAALEKSLACFTQALTLEPAYAQAHAGIATAQAIRAIVSLAAPHTVMPEAKEAARKTLALDEHDQAISWLQEAAEERDGLMTLVNTLPVFDPLHVDPRFQALLRRMNFPETAGTQPTT